MSTAALQLRPRVGGNRHAAAARHRLPGSITAKVTIAIGYDFAQFTSHDGKSVEADVAFFDIAWSNQCQSK
jgi:hypothetical protein